jgi:HlyD family secretion protein
MADNLSAELASLKIDRVRKSERGGGGFLRYVLIFGALAAAGLSVYLIVLPYLEAKIFKVEVGVTEIALVSPAQAQLELTAIGYVKAQRRSKVAAKVTGKVVRVMVSQGQRVAEGDILYELAVTQHQAAIAAANARVAVARARAQVERANLAELELQAKRATTLAQQGVRPESTAEDLQAQVASLQQRIRAVDAEVRVAQAEARALDVNLADFKVLAPIAGTVLSKPPEIGELVGPQLAGVSSEFGGIEIADFESLAVEVDVPEARLHLIDIGGPCEILLDAFPGQRYRGKTLEIIPLVDRGKATVTVKVGFVDAVNGVLPDMAARVNFLAQELDAEKVKEPPKLIVPSAALVERDGAKLVFVLDNGRVRMTPVTIGGPHPAGFELLSALPAGTRVVKEPPRELTDGQAVKEKSH